jgi:hypothetical protein
MPVGTDNLTPQGEYRDLIIEILGRAGGSADRQTVLQGIANQMRGRFLPGDLDSPRTRPQEAKWQNRASYERAAMVRERLLRADSPNGVWALTNDGFERYRKRSY